MPSSQSRFYENIIGRSRPFWDFFYPQLQAAWAPAFDDVPQETFYRALNESKPSLIRVEADEVTYGLHIMLRFELENDLINGRVAVHDLPKEWNARMDAYLGVVPPTDSDGVLQDIHWSQGSIGYFPDYLLGSIFSAQLWQAMQRDHPRRGGPRSGRQIRGAGRLDARQGDAARAQVHLPGADRDGRGRVQRRAIRRLPDDEVQRGVWAVGTLYRFAEHRSRIHLIRELSASPDGKRIAIASQTKDYGIDLFVFDVETGSLIELDEGDWIDNLVWLPER